MAFNQFSEMNVLGVLVTVFEKLFSIRQNAQLRLVSDRINYLQSLRRIMPRIVEEIKLVIVVLMVVKMI